MAFTIWTTSCRGRAKIWRRNPYTRTLTKRGYPPANEGVCTDVIWRALQNAGYDLKGMMDRDIREHSGDYPRVKGAPEPNIDLRRVPNQEEFFKKLG